ncbi:hypothetical protein EAF00_011678 [Botryotinia globosa]|nr:hypothetical protein EAF00_011678 [Botryotinia globosa]
MSSYEPDETEPGVPQEFQVAPSSGFNLDQENGDMNLTERGKLSEKDYASKVQDEATLAVFGKKQQLKRRFKSLSSVGLTCGLMLIWEVILFTLQFGLQNGGPAGLIYGFLAAWSGAMLQALVMAEMASIQNLEIIKGLSLTRYMIPLAGGPFNWVAILLGERRWLTVICWQAFVSETCYTVASLIQGLLILNYPDYDPKLWQATLLFYAIALFGVFINTYLGRLLPRIEAMMLIVYILGFIGVLIPIVYLSPHTPADKVFTTFQNLGGWDSMGISFFIRIKTEAKNSSFIAEEINQAARVIPFSIWFSTLFNGILGFSMMIAVLFGIQDIVTATQSNIGFPFMEIFQTALGSKKGANALIIVITGVNIFSVSSVLATASRTLWAFSRENGLPFSHLLVKVSPKTRLPINAIIETLIINVLLALISVGSYTAFGAFYSVVLAANHVMLAKRLKTPASEMPWGPFRLQKLGVPITVVAIIYTIIALFFSFWPAFSTMDAANMNWSCLIFGGAVIFSMIFWLLHGRKVYVGPIWESEGHFVRVK